MIRIYEYNQVGDAEIFARQEKKQDVSGAVSRIIADVRQNRVDALKRYGQEFDNAELQTLEVSAEERAAALAAVDADFLEILREAAAHIRSGKVCCWGSGISRWSGSGCTFPAERQAILPQY